MRFVLVLKRIGRTAEMESVHDHYFNNRQTLNCYLKLKLTLKKIKAIKTFCNLIKQYIFKIHKSQLV